MNLESTIPWLFHAGIVAASIRGWYEIRKKIYRMYPEKPGNPDDGFLTRLANGGQNELVALVALAIMIFCGNTAGRIGWYFVGKTTVSTASHATIKGIEGAGSLFSWTGEGVSSMFTAAGDAITNFSPELESPEELQKMMEEKSLFNADNSTSYNDTSYDSYNAPTPVQAAPIQHQAAPAQPEIVPTAVESGPVEQQANVDTKPLVVNAAPVSTNGQYQEYTVKPGDNMFQIAQRYYGNGYMFQEICGANTGVVGSNCNNIKVGSVLKIPSIDGSALVERPVVAQAAPAQQPSAPVIHQNVAGSNQPAVVNQPANIVPAAQVQAQAAASGGQTYTIQPGDNIFKIAQAAGGMSNVYAICSANRATMGNNCDQLTAGATIVLPSK